MTKLYRVGSGDPGGQKDQFGFVLNVADIHDRKIYVTGAHQWLFEENQVDYNTVEEDIMKIHRAKNLDIFVCEKNNTGHHVISSLKNIHHIPIWPIWTSQNIKSQKIIDKGRTMDKYEHIDWVNRQRQSGKIVLPKEKTAGIRQLEHQLGTFVRKYTNAGTVKYEAEGTIGKKFDDLVMAFLVNTYYIRRILFGDRGTVKRVVLNKKYEPPSNITNLGSGIPEGAFLTGTETFQPEGMMSGGYHIR